MSWNEGEAAADNWNDGGDTNVFTNDFTNDFTNGDTGDAAGGFGATDGGAGADFTCRK